jgi:hypothetical protein
VRRLAGEAARLRQLADDGRTYRADLIAATLEEGVRALGARFPREQTRAMLERATLEEIKATRDAYRAQGDERLGGGRLTTDEDTDPPRAATSHERERYVNPMAYRA